MKIKLLRYELTLQYLPGKYLYIANTLSIAYLKNETENNKWLNDVVHSVELHLNITKEKRKEFIKETSLDPILSKVKNYCKNGWPKAEEMKDDYFDMKTFQKNQADIHESGGLLFFNYRLIVPASLRAYMLNLLHEAHFGIEKTKARARQMVYWSRINNDIENLISKCIVCERFKSSNVKEPLIPHKIPILPFNKIGTDICDFNGQSFLIIQDYFSKWLEIIPIKNKNATTLIKKFKVVFATHGIPKTIISDNMSYNPVQFKDFAKQWNFQIVTSSPHYPRSNGQAERAVETAKKI